MLQQGVATNNSLNETLDLLRFNGTLTKNGKEINIADTDCKSCQSCGCKI